MWPSCFLNGFLIRHCPDKVMTQKMSDEAVFDPLASFELISAWFNKIQTCNIIIKIAQTTIVYAQWIDGHQMRCKASHDNHWCCIKIALKGKRNLPY